VTAEGAGVIRLGIQIARHDIDRIKEGRPPVTVPTHRRANRLLVRAYVRSIKAYALPPN